MSDCKRMRGRSLGRITWWAADLSKSVDVKSVMLKI